MLSPAHWGWALLEKKIEKYLAGTDPAKETPVNFEDEVGKVLERLKKEARFHTPEEVEDYVYSQSESNLLLGTLFGKYYAYWYEKHYLPAIQEKILDGGIKTLEDLQGALTQAKHRIALDYPLPF